MFEEICRFLRMKDSSYVTYKMFETCDDVFIKYVF